MRCAFVVNALRRRRLTRFSRSSALPMRAMRATVGIKGAPHGSTSTRRRTRRRGEQALSQRQRRVPRRRAPRCSPRRSSCAATSSGSPRSAARCRPAASRRTTLRGRGRRHERRWPTCSARTTRWSPISGCTARSASGPARCAPPCSARSTARRATSTQRVALAVIGRSPVERQLAFARERGWRDLSSIRPSATASRATTAASRPTASEWPALTCLVRRDGRVRHFWGARDAASTADPGQDPRGAPDPTPLWNILDLTPGRARHATGIRSSAY